MEWVLTVKVGLCLSTWCTVDIHGGFVSWDECNKEREVIVISMHIPDDHVLVAQCSPVKVASK